MAYTSEQINDALLADPEFRKADEKTQREWAMNAYKNAGFMSEGSPVVGGGVNRPLSTKEHVAGAARYALEGVPPVVAGLMVPPPFNIPAAGLAFAGGSQAADMLDVGLGLRLPPSQTQQALNAVKNVGFGSALEYGGQTIAKAVPRVLEAVTAPFKKHLEEAPYIAPNTLDPSIRKRVLEEEAKASGLYQPTPAEITGSKALAKIESVFDIMPASTGVFEKNRLGQLNALIQKRNDLLERVGSTGEDSATLGNEIQRKVDAYLKRIDAEQYMSLETARDALLKQLGSSESYHALGREAQESVLQTRGLQKEAVDQAWEYARKQVPEGQRIAPMQTTAEAKKIYEAAPLNVRDLLPSAVKRLLSSGNPEYDEAMKLGINEKVSRTQTGGPGYTPQGFKAVRDMVSQALDEAKAKVQGRTDTPEIRMLTQLKKAITADEQAFYEQLGGTAKDAFQYARTLSGEYKGTFNAKQVKNLLTTSPEIMDTLIRPNQTTNIDTMKQAMGDSGWKAVTESFTNKLFGADKDALPTGIAKSLDRYGRSTLERVYGNSRTVDQLYQAARYLDGEGGISIRDNDFLKRLVRRDADKVLDHILSTASTEAGQVGASRHLRIQELKSVVGDTQWNNVKELFLRRVLEENKQNIISPADVSTKLFKLGKETVLDILGEETGKDLLKTGLVSATQQSAARLAANPSGTTGAFLTYQHGALIMRDPIKGGLLVIGTDMAAKLYLSDFARKWLTEGFRVSATSKEAMNIFTKLTGFMQHARQRTQSAREETQP